MRKNASVFKLVISSSLLALSSLIPFATSATFTASYDEPPPAEKIKQCTLSPSPPSYSTEFCPAAYYLRSHIQKLDEAAFAKAIGSVPVLFLSDIHPNTSIKEWLGANMKTLRANGFTHFAMEALNSDSQPLIEQYKKDSSLRSAVVDLVTKEWNWTPEDNVDLMDAAWKAGIRVLALDNREGLAQQKEGATIRLRNIHMAERISEVLHADPKARVAAFVGGVHAKTMSRPPLDPTIPELLQKEAIESRTYNLDSGEDPGANIYGQIYLVENLDDSYVLPMPRIDALIDGVIFTQRSVVLGGDIKLAEVPSWGQTRRHQGECRYVSDLPGTFLCLTDTGRHLKSLMGRMSYMMEGRTGTLAASNDRAYNISKQARYAGHDIWGEDFNAFFQEFTKLCNKKNKVHCPNSFEVGLSNLISSEVKKRGIKDFVVLGLKADSDLSGNLSPELTHARYFLSKSYQEKVKSFWTQTVTAADKESITQLLKQTYNLDGPRGETLLFNEFQAYLLEDGADTGKLKDFYPKYGAKIKALLK